MSVEFEDLSNLAGRSLDHRYYLEKFIDRGGFGAVYRGRDQKFSDPSLEVVGANPTNGHIYTNATVAVKVGLSVREFMKEAKLAHEVEHENIVRVKDYGCDGGLAYLVMEFLHGDDLEKLFQRQGCKLADELLCKFVSEVGAALAHAHAHELIHRDLKPRNIILKESRSRSGDTVSSEKFVLLDFGIASKFNTKGTLANITQKGAGTIEYMAPELLKENPESTIQSDIYAFGVLLYQMMAGRVPFPQTDSSMMALTECVQRICAASPPRLGEVARDRKYPAAVIALVMECLDKVPAKRPASMSLVRERYLNGMRPPTNGSSQTIHAGDLPKHEPRANWHQKEGGGGRQRSKTPWGWNIVTVCLLIAAFVTVQQLLYTPDTPTANLFVNGKPFDGGQIEWAANTPLRLLYHIDHLPRRTEPKFESIDVPGVFQVKTSEGEIPLVSQIFEMSAEDLNSLPKQFEMTLLAKTSNPLREIKKTITIAVQSPKPWLPVDSTHVFSPAVDSRLYRVGNMVFANVLECRIAELSVRFRLVPGRLFKNQSVETFYIMERLVSNALFNKFAVETPGFMVPNQDQARVRGWESSSDPAVANAPVTNIAVLEAQQFADWLSRKSGSLPTCLEWDLASGYYDFRAQVELEFPSLSIPAEAAWTGKAYRIPILGTEAWIGPGPAACRFRDVGGREQSECSPYGCFYDQLLKSGKRPMEITASLSTEIAASRDLREVCPSGKLAEAPQLENSDYSARLRQLSARGVNENLWFKPNGKGQRVAEADELDPRDSLTLVNGLQYGDHVGFRIVLLTKP